MMSTAHPPRTAYDSTPDVIVGWDVGGVALKGAVAVDGRIVDAFRLPAALWSGLENLQNAFDTALRRVPPGALHILTLTGELSDLFEDRRHGVEILVGLAAGKLDGLMVYAGRHGIVPAAEAIRMPAAVASANWHATASFAARTVSTGLLVDIGSTTTDLIPFTGGTLAPIGSTDAERLASGALVYTGATRTPVMAICRDVPFAGCRQGLVAEHFADLADVRRLTREIPPDGGTETADRRPASLAASRARLARMIGRDAADAPDDAWDALARYIAERQLSMLFEAGSLVLSRGDLPAEAPVVGAGAGRFLTRALAGRLERRHVDFETLVPVAPGCEASASEVAPACAVALLVIGS